MSAPREYIVGKASSCWATIMLACLALVTVWATVQLFTAPSLNHDAAWYLYAANQWVRGAHLYKDIVDPNTPLIFYLSAIPALLGRASTLPLSIVFNLAVLIIIAICTGLAAYLCSLRFPELPRRVFGILIFSFLFAAIPLVISLDSFGQREHLFILLILPYLVLTLFPDVRERNYRTRCFCAALAAIGMNIKPYFLLPWIVLMSVEALVKGWRTVFRLENLVVGALTVILSTFFLFAHPDYLTRILPLTMAMYGAYDAPRSAILQKILGVAFIALTPLWLVGRQGSIPYLRTMVSACLGALLLLVFVQHKGWEYHFLPAHVLGFLIVAAVAALPCLKKSTSAKERVASICAIIACIITGSRALSVLDEGKVPATLDELVSIIPSHENVGIAGLSFSLYPMFPLVNYVGGHWALRFPSLWLLPGSYRNDITKTNTLSYHSPSEQGPTERFVFESIISDIIREKPRFLIVDTSNIADIFGQHHFDFLLYFSQDQRFAAYFRSYRLIRQARKSDLKFGSFDVYENVVEK